MSVQQKRLKNQLFTSMKQLGLETQLKKQIRIQLCEKLKQKDKLKDPQKTHQDKLFTRIVNSMIAQQLQKSGCQYACSVYSAQSGYDNQMLSRDEIVQVMGIQQSVENNSRFLNPNYSIIANLIKKKYPFNGGTFRHVTVQTSPQEIGYTLEQRLAKIDIDYRKNLSTSSNNNSNFNLQNPQIRSKLQSIEQQLKRSHLRDLQRFKQFQSHNIKVLMSQQWRIKFQQYSTKLGQQYSMKMNYLRKKYKNVQQDLINRNKVFDQKVNSATKSIKQKIQLLEMKTKVMQDTKKNLQIQRKRYHEQNQNNKKQIKKKILEHDTLLITANKKIDYQVNVAKLAYQQQYQQKQSQFLEKKKFIDQQYGKLMAIKDTVDLQKQQSEKLNNQNSTLRKQINQLQKQLRLIISQNSSKSDRIQNLRIQISELKQQKRISKQKIAEQKKKNKKYQWNLTDVKNQLEELRSFKERVEENNQMEQEERQNQQKWGNNQSNNNIGMQSQLELKLNNLRQQRKKEIQRLKLQI